MTKNPACVFMTDYIRELQGNKCPTSKFSVISLRGSHKKKCSDKILLDKIMSCLFQKKKKISKTSNSSFSGLHVIFLF